MPPKHKKSPSKPDPNRISTRPKNAVTHPGRIDTQCSTRRPESIIQAEKAEKAAKRVKKEQQSIQQDETAEAIAEYEEDMVINDAIEDTQFPRHRDKADQNGPMKQLDAGHRAPPHRSTSGTKRKKQSFEIVDNGPEVDSGVEEQPKSKRTRLGVGIVRDAARHSDSEVMEVESDKDNKILGEDADTEMSELTETEETPNPKRVCRNTLRRTETYIEENMDSGEENIYYDTQKPKEEKTGSDLRVEEDEDESVFVSPLKARKKPAPVVDSNSELTGTDDGGLEEKKKEKKNTGKQTFREMVQEKRVMRTTGNNSKASQALSSSRGDNGFDEINTANDESTFQPVPSKKKTQQVKKAPTLKIRVISSQGEDSLQARKSLSHRAEDANNDSQKRSSKAGEIKKTAYGNGDDLLQTRENKNKVSDDASAKPQQVKKASKTQGNNISQAAEEAPRPTSTMANKSKTSRTTANNPVSVVKASKPPAPKKKSLPKLKPDSMIATKTANSSLSGDEDQKEREDMLASPVKGSDARTASTALVKLEKNNEKPKNRSKAELLQLEKEDLITWNNTLEPNYVKYYLSTKTLWSADAKLLEVAQQLYDETLGSKKPLVLTPSSGPMKLLNQKLNDVRNQTGKIAITNLDASFLEAHDSESLQHYTPKSVANMRIKFAQNLLEGYQFLFGPDEDGSRTRGKRFFNPLILQTFSSIFKHTVGKAPPSFPQIGHPIAALTLACVSVERAVRISAEGTYDANTGKIIAKINPLTNKPSKETAFSSAIWADAANKYVTKITTLKDDVWKELMDEAAAYMAFTWENFTARNSLAASDPHAADRDRALFSDEE